MYDLIIVGAGPAGLTAALYALRANKKVLIFEAKSYGGQIIKAAKIENYPGLPNVSGFDYATILYNQVMDLGAEIKYETVIRIDKDKNVITNNEIYKAKAIILATGAESRKLGLKEEKNYIGKGVSYCATCDGNFYKNKVVAVVGGGNTALTDAIYLSDIASKVYLIHRKDTFKGEDKYLTELKNKVNVEFILNSNVVKINGDFWRVDIEYPQGNKPGNLHVQLKDKNIHGTTSPRKMIKTLDDLDELPKAVRKNPAIRKAVERGLKTLGKMIL